MTVMHTGFSMENETNMLAERVKHGASLVTACMAVHEDGANDDMHIFSRAGGAYNMVLCEEKSIDSIINAIKRGSFYASFGIKLEDIKVEDNIISLKNGDKRVPYVYFKFIGKNGKVLKEEKGNEASYIVKGDEGYIRVEAYREDGARAWLQPFLIEE